MDKKKNEYRTIIINTVLIYYALLATTWKASVVRSFAALHLQGCIYITCVEYASLQTNVSVCLSICPLTSHYICEQRFIKLPAGLSTIRLGLRIKLVNGSTFCRVKHRPSTKRSVQAHANAC